MSACCEWLFLMARRRLSRNPVVAAALWAKAQRGGFTGGWVRGSGLAPPVSRS